jgi:hypothetical protein
VVDLTRRAVLTHYVGDTDGLGVLLGVVVVALQVIERLIAEAALGLVHQSSSKHSG